eukprot:5731306-Lingulodinium_polyedra.AAC.1
MPGKSLQMALLILPHSLRPKQFSSSICMTARARLSFPAWYISSSARRVMAIASAPPDTRARVAASAALPPAPRC